MPARQCGRIDICFILKPNPPKQSHCLLPHLTLYLLAALGNWNQLLLTAAPEQIAETSHAILTL